MVWTEWSELTKVSHMETTTNSTEAMYNSLLTDTHNALVLRYMDAGYTPAAAIAQADSDMFSLLTVDDFFAGQTQDDFDWD